MPRNARVFLQDMIEASSYLLDEVAKIDYEAYIHNRTLQFAFLHNFTIIGEAMVQLRESFPKVFAKFSEANKITGFRNLIVHRYWEIDPNEVWSTLTTKVAPLREQLLQLVEELED